MSVIFQIYDCGIKEYYPKRTTEWLWHTARQDYLGETSADHKNIFALSN